MVLAAFAAQASPITFSGTFTNDSDVVLFEISGNGNFTATTSGFAQGGFNPLLFLIDPINRWVPTGNGQIADQTWNRRDQLGCVRGVNRCYPPHGRVGRWWRASHGEPVTGGGSA